MYGFLNDVSANHFGSDYGDHFELVKDWVLAVFELRKYGVTKVRVPVEFENFPIAGHRSLNSYSSSELFSGSKQSISNVFANLVETGPNQNAINTSDNLPHVSQVYLNGIGSNLLTEAHYSLSPAVSFKTHVNFCEAFLKAEVYVLAEPPVENQKIDIMNFYESKALIDHKEHLMATVRVGITPKENWDPFVNPIWNLKKTEDALKMLEFPKNEIGRGEKESFLRYVGTIVAEINGWIWDEKVSGWNKNSGQLRAIFRSNSSKTAYLSIDFERTDAEFELFDRNGDHCYPIDFTTGTKRTPFKKHPSIRVR